MRIKLITSVGSAALILSGSVLAASPVNFGTTARNATTGTVTVGTSCGAGFTCSAPVSDVNFFQQEIIDPATNARYFHTVVDEGFTPAAAGTPAAGFKDENWVKAGQQGIRALQQIGETKDSAAPVAATIPATRPAAGTVLTGTAVADTRDVFFNSTGLNQGWGGTDAAGLNGVAISQSVRQDIGTIAAVTTLGATAAADTTVNAFTAVGGPVLNETFGLLDGLSAAGATAGTFVMNAGRKLDIAQVTSTDAGAPIAGGTHQTFGYSLISGAFNATAKTYTVPGGGAIDVGAGTPAVIANANGTYGVVSGAGNTLALTYIGQSVDLGASLGGVNNMSWGYLANATGIVANPNGAATQTAGVEFTANFTSAANPVSSVATAVTGQSLLSTTFTVPAF